jgi:large subunit ribosomal protein L30
MDMTAKQTKPAQSGAGKKPGKTIRVTLVKGLRGAIQGHRASVKGLGLKHRQHTVEVEDTPSIRGMINHASYLLKVEE